MIYENMLADMLCEPEIAEYLLNLQLEWNLEFTKQAVKAGADVLYFGDDVGMQNNMTFSAELWRKMLKPKWGEIFSEAKKINKDVVIWYHSCGHIITSISFIINKPIPLITFDNNRTKQKTFYKCVFGLVNVVLIITMIISIVLFYNEK